MEKISFQRLTLRDTFSRVLSSEADSRRLFKLIKRYHIGSITPNTRYLAILTPSPTNTRPNRERLMVKRVLYPELEDVVDDVIAVDRNGTTLLVWTDHGQVHVRDFWDEFPGAMHRELIDNRWHRVVMAMIKLLVDLRRTKK